MLFTVDRLKTSNNFPRITKFQCLCSIHFFDEEKLADQTLFTSFIEGV